MTRPIRVLHLEDNPRDAEIIGSRLDVDALPCDIELTSTQEAFDAALARERFDLILCDYNLPGYDGLTALKRAKEIHPDVPVIIISGTVGEDDAVKCLHSGATDYLLKQRLERLGSAVRRAIEEADERRRRALAEEALQQREQRLSSIYDTVADALFYIQVERDGGYRFVSVNRAFVSSTGVDYDRVVGKRVESVIPARSLGTALEHYRRAVTEKRVVSWEHTVEYPKGAVIGEVSVAPVFDDAGRCTHLVGSMRDVTEHRQLEAQFRQAQKMESVGQLAGGIAHDFNNLLTVINGTAELVMAQVKEGDRRIEEDLQEIRRAGERAAALTRQLLAFSRKQILQPQIVNLNAIVEETGNLLRRLLGEDVDLTLTASPQPATIRADRGQIEQVIANLAVNARDAMPRGGKLTIATNHAEIDDRFGRQVGFAVTAGRYVALAVSDTGTGMDDATRRQIFEPFFTTKGPGKGTGLGLSTVYGIVKQSDGFITVESQPGHGSCFTVYLPYSADAPRGRRELPSMAPATGSETVLVVEDVSELRRLITRTLQKAGYTVLTAAEGEEALRVLEQHGEPVHLMVTDLVMPGMSGRDLAERVERTRPHMKVLYMSGYTDDVVVRHGIVEQGVRFVSKPFATAELLRTVREVLDAPRGSG
jgi:PAS domain S-box-containing protein